MYHEVTSLLLRWRTSFAVEICHLAAGNMHGLRSRVGIRPYQLDLFMSRTHHDLSNGIGVLKYVRVRRLGIGLLERQCIGVG